MSWQQMAGGLLEGFGAGTAAASKTKADIEKEKARAKREEALLRLRNKFNMEGRQYSEDRADDRQRQSISAENNLKNIETSQQQSNAERKVSTWKNETGNDGTNYAVGLNHFGEEVARREVSPDKAKVYKTFYEQNKVLNNLEQEYAKLSGDQYDALGQKVGGGNDLQKIEASIARQRKIVQSLAAQAGMGDLFADPEPQPNPGIQDRIKALTPESPAVQAMRDAYQQGGLEAGDEQRLEQIKALNPSVYDHITKEGDQPPKGGSLGLGTPPPGLLEGAGQTLDKYVGQGTRSFDGGRQGTVSGSNRDVPTPRPEGPTAPQRGLTKAAGEIEKIVNQTGARTPQEKLAAVEQMIARGEIRDIEAANEFIRLMNLAMEK